MSDSKNENAAVNATPEISLIFEDNLRQSFANARKQRHEFITVEHLLLALLDDIDARPILDACNANIHALREELTKFIDENVPTVDGVEEVDTQPTMGFQRVIQRAIMHVHVNRDSGIQVNGANAFVALFGEKDSHAVYYLLQQGITRLDVVNYISHGIRKSSVPETFEEQLGNLTSEAARPRDHELQFSDDGSKQRAGRFRVFISYSHLDSDCLDRLLVHLRPLERAKLIDSWSDRRIRSGDKWRNELRENIESAAVAVLLVSADFLASDFIVMDELPPILVKAESDGLRVIPVVLKPCGYLRDRTLQNFQAVNDPSKPLLGMAMIEQEFTYDKVASEIAEEIEMRLGRPAST